MLPSRRNDLAALALYFLVALLVIVLAGCATAPRSCISFSIPILGMDGTPTGKFATGEYCPGMITDSVTVTHLSGGAL